MKWKVLQTIRDRDTGELIQPGGIWDDRNQRTDYERDILIVKGVIAPLHPEGIEPPQESTIQDKEQ